jgi:peptide/nickel transport system permease protein
MQTSIVLVVMSMLVFGGVFLVGNPLDNLISPEASQADRDRAMEKYGLDKPMLEQYLTFVKNAAHGDLGTSFIYDEPSTKIIFQRMPATIELATFSLILSILIGVPCGLLAGLRPYTLTGQSIMRLSIVTFSLPSFWVALIFIYIFAVLLGWFPSSGRGETVDIFGIPMSFLTVDGFWHMFLPALNLSLTQMAMITRLVRADTMENLQLDYVKFAKAKGLRNIRIVGLHVLKNTLIPLITVIGMDFGALIAFAMVTESIFAWPGIGKLIIDSIEVLDRPVMVAYLMITVVLFVTINFIVDILYSAIDPRIRLGGGEKQ